MRTPTRPRGSARSSCFVESVIREMSRVARAHDAINLAQGFPDFPAPEALKEAAVAAIRDDINQYAVTWGAPPLRQAVAAFLERRRGLSVDPETQITVCCGATEAMIAAMLAVLDPGDGVLVPEPFYENYGPDGILSGAVPAFVPLGKDFTLDVEALEAAIGPRTRALVLNTPHNPTGRVFTASEMDALCALLRRHDLLLLTDEIYEEILYTGPHRSPMAREGMAGRTLMISGASKTFSVTGWRIGWVVSPPDLTGAVRKVHDFLTVGAPAPLQEAVAGALAWEDAYFDSLKAEYRERRDLLVPALQEAGFACTAPDGAYYVMTDVRELQREGEDDTDFAMRLVRDAGVATVPGSSFYADPARGRHQVRFCYAKKLETLRAAADRLLRWRRSC